MSTPQTTNGRRSDGAQRPPAGAAPPHSLEAEQSVLGAILLSEQHALRVRHRGGPARPRTSTASATARSTSRCSRCSRRASRSTSSRVTEHLRSRGKLDAAGGQAEIDALTAAVPAVGNLRRYAQIVRDHALLRRLLDGDLRDPGLASTATRRCRASIVERAERDDPRGRPRRPPEGLPPASARSCTTRSTSGRSSPPRAARSPARPSGFADLDAITGGFQPGNLIIIAARPSMGKSALVTNIAENVALNKDDPRPVALFSLEMSEAELAQRFIASQASIKGDDLRKGRAARRGEVEARAARPRASTTRRRSTSTTPRTSGSSRSAPRRGGCTSRPGRVRRARPDHRRLPAADARRRAHREPRPAGRRDEPRAEDPRARARACR